LIELQAQIKRKSTLVIHSTIFGDYSGERAVNPLHAKTSSAVVQVVQFL